MTGTLNMDDYISFFISISLVIALLVVMDGVEREINKLREQCVQAGVARWEVVNGKEVKFIFIGNLEKTK